MDLITYFGYIGACGIHLPGTQFRDAFGCNESTSMSMIFPVLCSSCSRFSLRCDGGSKEGRWALTPSLSFTTTFLYQGFFTPLSEVMMKGQDQTRSHVQYFLVWCRGGPDIIVGRT